MCAFALVYIIQITNHYERTCTYEHRGVPEEHFVLAAGASSTTLSVSVAGIFSEPRYHYIINNMFATTPEEAS
jgi:hypothetical protein